MGIDGTPGVPDDEVDVGSMPPREHSEDDDTAVYAVTDACVGEPTDEIPVDVEKLKMLREAVNTLCAAVGTLWDSDDGIHGASLAAIRTQLSQIAPEKDTVEYASQQGTVEAVLGLFLDNMQKYLRQLLGQDGMEEAYADAVVTVQQFAEIAPTASQRPDIAVLLQRMQWRSLLLPLLPSSGRDTSMEEADARLAAATGLAEAVDAAHDNDFLRSQTRSIGDWFRKSVSTLPIPAGVSQPQQ